jgi:spore germination cell wall hydrolase CwlJ-like protein
MTTSLNKILVIFLLLLTIQVNATHKESNLSRQLYEDIQCLTENIYFEARSQSTAGWLGIASVTINRFRSEKFPDSICGVVYQGPTHEVSNVPLKNKCQFSWYCDGVAEYVEDVEMFFEIMRFTEIILNSQVMMFDVTDGATHYHNDSVEPHWAKSMTRTIRIDNHIFYRED